MLLSLHLFNVIMNTNRTHCLLGRYQVYSHKQEFMSHPKKHTIAIYENVECAAGVILDDVSSSHVFTGDIGSHIQ